MSRFAVAELLLLLPKREAAALLVDTYFDRVHWFMLIFHQDDFRKRWPQLYEHRPEQVTESCKNAAFVSTFLMVIAIGLQYTGAYRRHLLEKHDIDPEALRECIFSTIQNKLLDIVALGQLESVQTCVLLGTYYLYHGNPGLAWPVCGCGLRVAQALSLHRKLPLVSNTHSTVTSPELRRQTEERKRCWWAIYEIETFCSMSYGYPHSLKDADCDVEPLDPSAKTPGMPPSNSLDRGCPGKPSLLSYKYFMSKLSVITKAILTELYRVGQDSAVNWRHTPDSSLFLHHLIDKVTDLDAQLRQWKAEIPSRLQLKGDGTPSVNYVSVEEMDRDVGASGQRFEDYIYQLQALVLELAYENARILVHRPLLSYKMVTRGTDTEPSNSTGHPHNPANPFHHSLGTCRDAALRTSEIGSMPIFSLASRTYAAAFISIHTFTAGVTLCILSSIEPLTFQSHKSKIGLQRLMAMQMSLKSTSVLAAQGLDILQRLTKLVVERELNELLGISRHESLPETLTDAGPEVNNNWRPPPTSNGLHAVANTSGPVGDPTAATVTHETVSFDYIEDPAMSRALCDFDQGTTRVYSLSFVFLSFEALTSAGTNLRSCSHLNSSSSPPGLYRGVNISKSGPVWFGE